MSTVLALKLFFMHEGKGRKELVGVTDSHIKLLDETVQYSTWPPSLSHILYIQQCVEGKDWVDHCRRHKLGPKQPQEPQTSERGRGHGDQGLLSYG